MNTEGKTHPLQKQIDKAVADVRSGEVTLSTVQWWLTQALMSAEIEMQALAILEQGAMIPVPVSTNEQILGLINKQIELAEQNRCKEAATYQDLDQDKATRIEAGSGMQYYLGEKRGLETLRDQIEISNFPVVATAWEAGAQQC